MVLLFKTKGHMYLLVEKGAGRSFRYTTRKCWL